MLVYGLLEKEKERIERQEDGTVGIEEEVERKDSEGELSGKKIKGSG